jgi:hypothetical protein
MQQGIQKTTQNALSPETDSRTSVEVNEDFVTFFDFFNILIISCRVACDFPNCQYVAVYAAALKKHKNFGKSPPFDCFEIFLMSNLPHQPTTCYPKTFPVQSAPGSSEMFPHSKGTCGKTAFLDSISFSNSFFCSVHTGEKPFKCTNEGCDRAFCDRKGLRNHEEKCLHPRKPESTMYGADGKLLAKV